MVRESGVGPPTAAFSVAATLPRSNAQRGCHFLFAIMFMLVVMCEKFLAIITVFVPPLTPSVSATPLGVDAYARGRQ